MSGRSSRRKVVVFLDVNISARVAVYLKDLKDAAHWISFCGKKKLSDEEQEFFDSTGAESVFKRMPHPVAMKDAMLLKYMVRLINERYGNAILYIFYTYDRKFLSQKSMQKHPLRHYLTDGRIIFVPLKLSSPENCVKKTADLIRSDFKKRLKEAGLDF